MVFDPAAKTVVHDHEAVVGPDEAAARKWIEQHPDPAVFIEGYRPRSNLHTDQRMVEAVARFKTELHGVVLLNYGVKKVVRQPLMELLGVWSFTTPTHHDDLRSAARIALLGMLKDEALNALLTQVVTDHLDGRSWRVHRQG